MSSATGPGPEQPYSRPTPRPPGAPGNEDSGCGDSKAVGRNMQEDIERASGAGVVREHGRMAESDPDAQPVDPALIAGGEDIVGVGNDMTTGPDTMGATTGGDRAPAARADSTRSSRDDGSTGGV